MLAILAASNMPKKGRGSMLARLAPRFRMSNQSSFRQEIQMSKSKPYVIYKQFWTSDKAEKWLAFTNEQEAIDALVALESSSSARYNSYTLVDNSKKEKS